ncbi:MAG: glutathione peroxidase [Schleiferiaceae bacterium]|nr:glutathione peroxidase [Schleiferiaceae bacterium]
MYSIHMKSLMGDPIDMSTLKGKKILFVNVASRCGYTSQYKELQALHEKHGDQVAIVGLPCNQFGGQEPGTANEIADFCEKNYGVTFLMTEKIDVKGNNQHPLYRWLTSKNLNNVEDSEVRWNFQKYLVSEDGQYLQFFSSSVSPMSKELIAAIER